jgi:hypothetical protein
VCCNASVSASAPVALVDYHRQGYAGSGGEAGWGSVVVTKPSSWSVGADLATVTATFAAWTATVS